MKYTVIIRQPVPDEVRPRLQEQLVERFGLNEQQAERLASRRAGRLMKPTAQARAELLLSVFQSVDAQVSLEEVPEDTDAPAQAFGASPSDHAPLDASFPAAGAAPASTFSAFVPSPDIFGGAALDGGTLGGGTLGDAGDSALGRPAPTPITLTPNSSVSVSAAPAAGAAAPVQVADPFAASPFASDALPDWARPAAAAQVSTKTETAPLTGIEAQLASELSALSATPAAPVVASGGDDWADFAGGLNLPETSAPAQDSAPRQTTEFLTAVTEDAPVQTGPRGSVATQIRNGALLPVALSGLLTLGLLGLLLPTLQRQQIAHNAQTVASTLALSLDNAANKTLSAPPLDALVKSSGVGFARIELPNGTTYTRSGVAAQDDAYNKQLGDWVKTAPAGGTVNLGGKRYMVSRVSLVRQSDGQLAVTNAAGESKGTLVRRVAVGLPANTGSALLNTFLAVLLSTIIGAVIAAWLAAQAARRIMQPLSELVKAADAISLGELSRPVRAEQNDEIGDLAQALERMRLSLEAAMDRLRRRKRG